MAPMILVPLFKNPKSGLKKVPEKAAVEVIEPYKTLKQSPHMLSAMHDFLTEAFEGAGYDVLKDDRARGLTEFEHGKNDQKLVTVKRENGELIIDCSNEAVVDVDNIVDAGLNHFEQAVSDLKDA